MKIIGICGSPRGEKSQTRKLLIRFLEICKENGFETEIFDLSKEKVGFCLACEKCHKQERCPIPDDRNLIVEKMLLSDGIVFASPVYIDNVSAQIKALFDRTSHFIHCLRLEGKYTFGIVTSGSGKGEMVLNYLKHYSNTVGAQFVDGINLKVPLKNDDYEKLKESVGVFLGAIKEKKEFKDQKRKIERNKEYFKKLVEMRKDEWKYEYEYWQKI
ncbi:MAG: flavodoxin family protein [Candidatus Ratteibacteria bacterium]